MNREQIARVCHEVNRAYCEALGDMSQPAWEDAPQWQRDSAMMGVNLHCDNNVGPEASHESWMAQKVSEGWVYGPVKDPEAKTHHCIVPFDMLPGATSQGLHLSRCSARFAAHRSRLTNHPAERSRPCHS